MIERERERERKETKTDREKRDREKFTFQDVASVSDSLEQPKSLRRFQVATVHAATNLLGQSALHVSHNAHCDCGNSCFRNMDQASFLLKLQMS